MRARALLSGVALASAPAIAQTNTQTTTQPMGAPPATAAPNSPQATGTATPASQGDGTAPAGLPSGSAPAAATPSDGSARTTYDAAYFATFGPSTALQIVARVPGFTLDVGDQEVRGFNGAAGNVVINGQRPSAKADGLNTILSRIPANRVLRVEVGRGDLFGSEFAGKAQVLNIVLTGAGGLSGTVDAGARRVSTGGVYPQGSASAVLQRGPSSFSLAAGIVNDTTPESGSDTVTDLATGQVIEFRRKLNEIADPNGYVSAAWSYDGGANRTAHLNGRYAIDRFSLTQTNRVSPTEFEPLSRDDRLTQRYRRREFEIGGDVTRPFLGGGLKLVGLATRRYRHLADLSLNRTPTRDLLGGFAQDLDDTREETVARAAYTRPDLLGWSVEIGVEGVLNRLRSNVGLFALDATGARSPLDLPIAKAVVTEYRGEAFANAGRALTKRLRLDLGLNYEASRLTVTGDAIARRSLQFLKPKVTLDWTGGGGAHVQLSVARTVAQLQFEDFISSAELTNDRVNGGNANLLPQRAYEVRAVIEKPILGDGLAKLEFGYDAISLLQDRILTPEGFDAPGNLGSAKRVLLRTTIDAPLTSIGLAGVRLTGHASLVGTRVRDPYTLRPRPFSGTERATWDIGLRRDRGPLAITATVYGESGGTTYRRDELDENTGGTPYIIVTADYQLSKRTTVTLGVENLAQAASFRDRLFFDPDRRSAVPYLEEGRIRNQRVKPYVTIKHSFG